jgi:hypothetical protein
LALVSLRSAERAWAQALGAYARDDARSYLPSSRLSLSFPIDIVVLLLLRPDPLLLLPRPRSSVRNLLLLSPPFPNPRAQPTPPRHRLILLRTRHLPRRLPKTAKRSPAGQSWDGSSVQSGRPRVEEAIGQKAALDEQRGGGGQAAGKEFERWDGLGLAGVLVCGCQLSRLVSSTPPAPSLMIDFASIFEGLTDDDSFFLNRLMADGALGSLAVAIVLSSEPGTSPSIIQTLPRKGKLLTSHHLLLVASSLSFISVTDQLFILARHPYQQDQLVWRFALCVLLFRKESFGRRYHVCLALSPLRSIASSSHHAFTFRLFVSRSVRAVASIVMLGALLYWLYSRSQRG